MTSKKLTQDSCSRFVIEIHRLTRCSPSSWKEADDNEADDSSEADDSDSEYTPSETSDQD